MKVSKDFMVKVQENLIVEMIPFEWITPRSSDIRKIYVIYVYVRYTLLCIHPFLCNNDNYQMIII